LIIPHQQAPPCEATAAAVSDAMTTLEEMPPGCRLVFLRKTSLGCTRTQRNIVRFLSNAAEI